MNEKFVKDLYEMLVTDGIETYRELLETTNKKEATDRNWIAALDLYENLTPNQRTSMLNFMKVIIIDTISSVFGVLDGSTTLSGDEFEVEINGVSTENELQDTFLEYVEDMSL